MKQINMWKTPVYNAQCTTFAVARELTRNQTDVSSLDDINRPPFCLRTVKALRTPSIQAFRDNVAAVVRASRRSVKRF